MLKSSLCVRERMVEDTKGLTVRKQEDLSEWYQQVILKAGLARYTAVSGCIAYLPRSYAIWERIQDVFNRMIKATGHANAYFPLFIPESLFQREEEHVEGFTPEVAWVTEAGSQKLRERLAVRPTSETIIYDTIRPMLRSYRDLPLLLNQWCNVVRWEFKHATPFLRGREFLWQEGHTVHATRDEALEEVYRILDFYQELVEDYLAIPVYRGRKSEGEKFAGADMTTTLEAVMPNGRAVQMATSHHLGEHFTRAFDVKVMGEDGQAFYPQSTSWGLSTRVIGALILTHGDDKGLIIPPRIAPEQARIIPIYQRDTRTRVETEAERVRKLLEEAGVRVTVDTRDGYTPGWKYSQQELEGVPLRIEIGMRDIEQEQVMLARRDTGERTSIPMKDLPEQIPRVLEDIQKTLYERARAMRDDLVKPAGTLEDVKTLIAEGRLALAGFCGRKACEEKLKEETGVNSRVLLEEGGEQACIICGGKGVTTLIGRSY